jgi:hypothetical protein
VFALWNRLSDDAGLPIAPNKVLWVWQVCVKELILPAFSICVSKVSS